MPTENPPAQHDNPLAYLVDYIAEENICRAVLSDPGCFQQANLKSSDFFIHRWKWFWEACETIVAMGDTIDLTSLQRELEKSGHYEDVTAYKPLICYATGETQHVRIDAQIIRELARRRRMLVEATEMAQRALDTDTPLPELPGEAKTTWTPGELAAQDFPDPGGPVPGLLPTGLTVLGGRPKRGKSWLMLQCGCALGLGGKFLGRDVQPMGVRYYALEDPPRRLKGRLVKLGIPDHAHIVFVTSLPPLHLQGMAEIEQAARSGEYGLIVIDTIRRAMPGRDFKKDGALFDDILGKLQNLAQETQIAIVVILHTRKASFGLDPDPVDDVLGSTGLTASADCVLALYTEQGKKGATLKGRGRDLDDIDLALQFDPLTCCWQCVGETEEVKISEVEDEIILVLQETGKGTATSIANAIHKDVSNTRRRLISLWMKGKIKKDETRDKPYYYLTDFIEKVPTINTT